MNCKLPQIFFDFRKTASQIGHIRHVKYAFHIELFCECDFILQAFLWICEVVGTQQHCTARRSIGLCAINRRRSLHMRSLQLVIVHCRYCVLLILPVVMLTHVCLLIIPMFLLLVSRFRLFVVMFIIS